MTLQGFVSLMQVVLIGVGLLVAMTAPLHAWVFHKRQRTPMTRRSMLLITLAYECLAAGALCNGAALQLSDFALHTVLAIAGFMAFLGYFLFLILALTGQQRKRAAGRRDDGGGPPIQGR